MHMSGNILKDTLVFDVLWQHLEKGKKSIAIHSKLFRHRRNIDR